MARARQGDFNYVNLAFKSCLNKIKDIKTVLDENRDRYLLFRGTPFGPWLDLSMPGQDPLLVHMFLQKEVTVGNPDPEKLYFDVYGHSLCFGRQEFCLVTGLRFGLTPSLPPLPRESFVSRVFPDAPPKELQTRHVFERMKRNNMEDLSQDDVVRVCLVVMVELVFIGRELKQYVSDTVLRAVEDLQVFRNYPWGAYIWGHTFKQMHQAISRRRNPKNPTGGMTMSGFTYAFKVWILETFPIALTHFQRHMDRSPRGICWDRGAILSRLQCLEFFNSVGNASHHPLSCLVATLAEQQMAWYRDSQAFFHGEEARRPSKRVRQPSKSPICSSPSAGSLSDNQDDEGNELPPSRHHEWDYARRNYINTHSFNEPPTYINRQVSINPNPDPSTSQVMPAKLKVSCIEANNDIERLKEIWLKNRETQLQKEALIEEKKRQLAVLQQEISEEEYTVRAMKESYTGLEEMINEKAEWISKCKNIYPY